MTGGYVRARGDTTRGQRASLYRGLSAGAGGGREREERGEREGMRRRAQTVACRRACRGSAMNCQPMP